MCLIWKRRMPRSSYLACSFCGAIRRVSGGFSLPLIAPPQYGSLNRSLSPPPPPLQHSLSSSSRKIIKKGMWACCFVIIVTEKTTISCLDEKIKYSFLFLWIYLPILSLFPFLQWLSSILSSDFDPGTLKKGSHDSKTTFKARGAYTMQYIRVVLVDFFLHTMSGRENG